MTLDLSAAMQATWTPARSYPLGPFVLRDGAGGGKRVSAASLAETDWTMDDLAMAEVAMRDMGGIPLFTIWPDIPAEAILDAQLAQRGYVVIDPVIGYTAPIQGVLGADIGTGDTYPNWPPLAICRAFWANAGIGPARIAVMARVQGAKTVILTRGGDDLAGVCFVAMAGTTAMVHALKVAPTHRRQGYGQNLLAGAARWAQQHGAVDLALVVTCANSPARALYAKLGMKQAGHYHYRQFRQEGTHLNP